MNLASAKGSEVYMCFLFPTVMVAFVHGVAVTDLIGWERATTMEYSSTDTTSTLSLTKVNKPKWHQLLITRAAVYLVMQWMKV